MMATSGRSWLDRMLSRQSRSSGAPIQPLPPPGHVFVQSARSTTVGRAARVMPALAPARGAALARADAPRRELPVLGAKQKLDAAPAPAPKRGRRSGTLEDDWRNRASPSQIASDLAALCERGCRCGCAKKYFAGPENLTADATRTRALLKGYDQQQRREYLRTYLQNHRCREKGGSWKFSFSLEDASKPCRRHLGLHWVLRAVHLPQISWLWLQQRDEGHARVRVEERARRRRRRFDVQAPQPGQFCYCGRFPG